MSTEYHVAHIPGIPAFPIYPIYYSMQQPQGYVWFEKVHTEYSVQTGCMYISVCTGWLQPPPDTPFLILPSYPFCRCYPTQLC